MKVYIVDGKTQADGAFAIDLVSANSFSGSRYNHQIQIEITGSPTAGTLTIAGKSPGSSGFDAFDGTIDMVNGPLIKLFSGHFIAIQITPVGFDGASYDVRLSSS